MIIYPKKLKVKSLYIKSSKTIKCSTHKVKILQIRSRTPIIETMRRRTINFISLIKHNKIFGKKKWITLTRIELHRIIKSETLSSNLMITELAPQYRKSTLFRLLMKIKWVKMYSSRENLVKTKSC